MSSSDEPEEVYIEDPAICFWCPGQNRPTVYVDILGFPWCKECLEEDLNADI